MIRWLVGITVAFLIIDHLWVHYGGPIIEKWRGEYREELKKGGGEEVQVPLEQAYRKSILDSLWERIREVIRKDDKKEGG